VIELLELTSKQAADLDDILARFVEHLRAEELLHAYVSVTPGGEDEIVVPGFPTFDRTGMVNRFRDEVTATLGADVGDFVAEEIYWDSNLAAGNSELRLGIQGGADGVERVVFTRHVRRPAHRGSEEIFGGVKVRFAATNKHKTISILSLGINPRYTHLLSAADALPRVTARARSSN